MKRTTLLLLAVLLTLAVACTANPPPPETPPPTIPEWTFTVVTPDGEKAFTSADAAKLEIVTIDVTSTNKDGESNTSTYVGVKLVDILKTVGVNDCSGVTVFSSDDFEAEYNRDLTFADDTILAWERDGEVLATDPPLRMVPNQGTGNQSIKSAAKVVVNP